MKIAVVPSNQHRNYYAGQWQGGRRYTEQDWAVRAGYICLEELREQGQTADIFWVYGSGTASTDELQKMMDKVKAYKPDVVISLHSDVGYGTRHIYPLIRRLQDKSFAMAVARNLAIRLRFGVQNATVRTPLLFFNSMKLFPKIKMVLLEIGQHSPNPKDAAFNRTYADFEGKMAARALLQSLNIRLIYDGPVQGPVPPGLECWLQK